MWTSRKIWCAARCAALKDKMQELQYEIRAKMCSKEDRKKYQSYWKEYWTYKWELPKNYKIGKEIRFKDSYALEEALAEHQRLKQEILDLEMWRSKQGFLRNQDSIHLFMLKETLEFMEKIIPQFLNHFEKTC